MIGGCIVQVSGDETVEERMPNDGGSKVENNESRKENNEGEEAAKL